MAAAKVGMVGQSNMEMVQREVVVRGGTLEWVVWAKVTQLQTITTRLRFTPIIRSTALAVQQVAVHFRAEVVRQRVRVAALECMGRGQVAISLDNFHPKRPAITVLDMVVGTTAKAGREDPTAAAKPRLVVRHITEARMAVEGVALTMQTLSGAHMGQSASSGERGAPFRPPMSHIRRRQQVR